jgi:hypothetical protein
MPPFVTVERVGAWRHTASAASMVDWCTGMILKHGAAPSVFCHDGVGGGQRGNRFT